ncbi:GNAT family N-acetyltransferase [Streptomyces avicenniae]|uniref:GNAT family N-acetyltransferase n=1 Tax=Streptomyces avicenniae TaxID=500153 RepID=UPI000699A768|nr:GNAT family N-acetyltransferase [Streptomyces avicenniae]
MTTTLRPDGPQTPTPGGGRTRSYRIRVNGRDAGGLVLASDGPRPATGRIVRLTVDEADRRRGRGTVAALAAEEILRDWGCADAGAVVPADATTALRLAASLGWTERARTFGKPLPGQEQPGRERPAQEPSGPFVRVLREEDTGETLGTVRMSPTGGPPDGAGAHVHSLTVAEAHRGRGHVRALLLLAEETARAAGRPGIGVTLPLPAPYGAPEPGVPDPTRADRLLRALGYRPTAHHVYKSLR